MVEVRLEGMKCDCDPPSYIFITSIMPNGQVNICCSLYIYFSGKSGCSGFIYEGEIFYQVRNPFPKQDPLPSNIQACDERSSTFASRLEMAEMKLWETVLGTTLVACAQKNIRTRKCWCLRKASQFVRVALKS